jgi:rhodanese-related sulfurtransferase
LKWVQPQSNKKIKRGRAQGNYRKNTGKRKMSATHKKLLWKHFFIACALSFAMPALTSAEEKKLTPTVATGIDIITVEQAKALMGKAQFYDMRSAVNYGKGHLKGAVAMPYQGKSENTENFDASKDQFDTSKLPSDKAVTLVFYSDSPTGWKSYKAAILSKRAGYKNVKWLREGVDGWSAKGLSLE